MNNDKKKKAIEKLQSMGISYQHGTIFLSDAALNFMVEIFDEEGNPMTAFIIDQFPDFGSAESYVMLFKSRFVNVLSM